MVLVFCIDEVFVIDASRAVPALSGVRLFARLYTSMSKGLAMVA